MKKTQTWPIVAGLCALVLMAGALANASGEHGFSVRLAACENSCDVPDMHWAKDHAPALMVTLKNKSRRPVTFNLTNAAFDYRLIVLDDEGRRVPETEAFLNMKHPPKGTRPVVYRDMLVILRPNESHTETIPLATLYEVNRPGRYTIRAEFRLPSQLGTGTVSSNVLTIAITK